MLELDAYLDRIGHRGPLAPDLATLTALVDAHVRRVPFENLDVLLGRPIKLDLASLQQKLVGARRGGYCFEHATLFAAVLERVGFAVTTHSARVTMFVPKEEAPRTHMFLTVPVAGRTYVLDPGFGGLSPRVPVPLDGESVRSGADAHRIVREGDDYVLEATTPEKVVRAWTGTLAREYPIDYELANHFTSTHPASHFTHRLSMRAFTDGGKVTVVNRQVTRWRGATSEITQLATGADLAALVATDFGFSLPEVAALALPE